MLDHLEFWPDVIHCNDWQTALIPIYLKDDGAGRTGCRAGYYPDGADYPRHIEYQGRYDPDRLGRPVFRPGPGLGWE